MSFPLPNVDLTSAAVGSTGIISLQNVGISAGGVSANPSLNNKPATIFMFNDSGCGLQIIFSQTGAGINLPAGGWVPIPLPPGENKITWTVLYVLPNPPVSLLMLTYYQPGESIPQSMTLGNSPVGIGGSVQTSSVQTLSNEGNAANTLVIDIGDAALSQLFTLYTDGHTIWKVDQSGVAHQVFKVQTAGNPLQLGQAADITEVLGNLTVDQATTLTGLLTATGQITGAAAQNLDLNAVTLKQVRALINNVAVMAVDAGGLNFSSGKLFDLAGNKFADWTAGGVIICGQASSHNRFNYQGDGVNTDWFINLIGPAITGSASATVNHLCKEFNVSTAPNNFIINSSTAGGSQTNGFNTITATQVNIVIGATNAYSFKGVLL